MNQGSRSGGQDQGDKNRPLARKARGSREIHKNTQKLLRSKMDRIKVSVNNIPATALSRKANAHFLRVFSLWGFEDEI